jgi:hypothetical protein
LCARIAPARRSRDTSPFKKIAPPLALCFFTNAPGHSSKRDQEQGLVLRSSADETGYLLSARNKTGRIVCKEPKLPLRSGHIAECEGRVGRGKTRARAQEIAKDDDTKTPRRCQGDTLMTTVGNVSVRYVGSTKSDMLNTGSCSAIVRKSRPSARPPSFAAIRSAARAIPASRSEIMAPPLLN